MKDPRQIPEDTFEKVRRKVARIGYSNRVLKHQRSMLPRCSGKQAYHEADAENVRKKLLALNIASYLRIYRCPKGTHWHLTHKKPR